MSNEVAVQLDIKKRKGSEKRLDRKSKADWKHILDGGLYGIVDSHSLKGDKHIFGRWNLFLIFFKKVFSDDMYHFLDKYGTEYAALRNITLGVTYPYDADFYEDV